MSNPANAIRDAGDPSIVRGFTDLTGNGNHMLPIPGQTPNTHRMESETANGQVWNEPQPNGLDNAWTSQSVKLKFPPIDISTGVFAVFAYIKGSTTTAIIADRSTAGNNGQMSWAEDFGSGNYVFNNANQGMVNGGFNQDSGQWSVAGVTWDAAGTGDITVYQMPGGGTQAGTAVTAVANIAYIDPGTDQDWIYGNWGLNGTLNFQGHAFGEGYFYNEVPADSQAQVEALAARWLPP